MPPLTVILPAIVLLFAAELASFREKEEQAKGRLTQLLSQSPEGVNKALISDEVQEEIKKLRKESAEFSRKARELEKEVTRDFKRKQSFFKFTNFLLCNNSPPRCINSFPT